MGESRKIVEEREEKKVRYGELENVIKEKEGMIEELRGNLDVKDKKEKLLNRSLSKEINERMVTVEEANKFKDKMHEKESEILRLTDTLRDTQQQVNKANEQINLLTTKIKDKEQKLDSNVTHLQTIQKDNSTVIARLQNEVQKMETETATIEKEKELAIRQFLDYKSESMEISNKSIQLLHENNQKLTQEQITSQTNINQMKNENTLLEEKLEKAKKDGYEEVERKNIEIKSLKETINSKKQRNIQLKTENSKIEKLEEQLSVLEVDNSTMATKNMDNKQEISEIQEKLHRLNIELNQNNATHQNELTSKEAQIQGLSDTLNKMIEEKERILTEKAQTEEGLEGQTTNLSQKIQEKETMIDDYRVKFVQKEKIINDLQVVLQTQESKIKELEHVQQESKELNESVRQGERNNYELELDLKKSQRKEEEQKAQNIDLEEKYKQKLDTLQMERRTLDEEKKDLVAQIDRKQVEVEENHTKYKKKEKELMSTEESLKSERKKHLLSIEEFASKLKSSTSEIEEIRKLHGGALTEYQEKIDKGQREELKATTIGNELKHKLNSLNTEHSEMEDKYVRVCNRLEELENTKSTTQGEYTSILRAAKEEKESLERRVAKGENESQEYEARISKLEVDLNLAKMDAEEERKKHWNTIEEYTNKSKTVGSELDDTRQQYNKRVDGLQRDLDNMKLESSQHKEKYDKTKMKVRTLNERLKEHKKVEERLKSQKAYVQKATAESIDVYQKGMEDVLKYKHENNLKGKEVEELKKAYDASLYEINALKTDIETEKHNNLQIYEENNTKNQKMKEKLESFNHLQVLMIEKHKREIIAKDLIIEEEKGEKERIVTKANTQEGNIFMLEKLEKEKDEHIQRLERNLQELNIDKEQIEKSLTNRLKTWEGKFDQLCKKYEIKSSSRVEAVEEFDKQINLMNWELQEKKRAIQSQKSLISTLKKQVESTEKTLKSNLDSQNSNSQSQKRMIEDKNRQIIKLNNNLEKLKSEKLDNQYATPITPTAKTMKNSQIQGSSVPEEKVFALKAENAAKDIKINKMRKQRSERNETWNRFRGNITEKNKLVKDLKLQNEVGGRIIYIYIYI